MSARLRSFSRVFVSLAWLPVACSAGGKNNLGNGAGGGSGGTNVIQPTGGTGASMDDGGACAQAESMATLVSEPIDIILVLDNSGSMREELDAVEQNINVNFAQILEDSDVDYRVILISRHRRAARDANAEASTSICVAAPLSGLAVCPGPAPVFSDHFFHYYTKIESTDSFDITLDTYAPPFATGFEDRSNQASLGWSDWLREGTKKVFLELTDDNEDMPVSTFLAGLTAQAPEHFGSDPAAPNLVFHSIIGIGPKAVPTEPYLPSEPISNALCPDVTTAGQTYQELSILTGGLRFPICQFDAYDVVFRRIAEDVVMRSQLACDFAIPPVPEGTELELDNVAVSYVAGNGLADQTFLQAQTPADCGFDAFYVEGDRIVLCPQACSIVQADDNARVDVLFTCESTIIVR